jgi:hypothetical protein
MKTHFFAMLIMAAGSAAAGTTNPALPREYVDTTLAAQTGAVLQVAADCSDLQARIDAARAGDTVEIPQQATCTGNYVLRSKPSGAGWIVIRTAAIAGLPGPNRRITPGQASLLPKILAAGGLPAFRTEPGAHHYRLIGLEVTAPENVATNDLITLGDGSPAQSTLAQTPSDFIIDRCYIHGSAHQKIKRGVALNSARSAVINSYFSELHTSSLDSQAICGWNGPGPYEISNNFLSASTENVLFGGAQGFIPDVVPSDIVISGNHFYKPLSWKQGDPSYAGDAWVVKNSLEFKTGRRVLIEGNLFDQSLGGYAILFTVRAENAKMPWAVVEDVTFRSNLVRHAAGGIDILGNDDESNGMGSTRRILIAGNVFEDIDPAHWGGSGWAVLVLRGPADVQLDHNTMLQKGAAVFADSPIPGPSQNFVFTNNISSAGINGSGHAGGKDTLDYYFPGATVSHNVFVNTDAAAYPSGNYHPADLSALRFVDLANGNYRLAPDSPYRAKGTDGENLGADIESVQQLAGAALAGTVGPFVSRSRAPREPRGPIR